MKTENKARHTPGPWKIEGNYCVADDGYEIARINPEGGMYDSQSQVDNNACLIAAAPELLEAAKAALVYGTDAGVRQELKAAIAKAEGK